MLEEKGKRFFSQDEMRKIFELVKLKERADKVTQKSIRSKLREIGLYWSEVGRGMDYTVDNLQKLFEDGTLSVKGITTYNIPAEETAAPTKLYEREKGRKTSDESYVIDLCDEILGSKALRQYRFDFLKGDAGTRLPVDAFYPELKIVVEYYESQHTQATPFFDNKQTVSGVSRGEQRRIYDQRRKEVLPEHDIKLIIISYTDFGTSKHLKRNRDHDLRVIKDILMKSGCNF